MDNFNMHLRMSIVLLFISCIGNVSVVAGETNSIGSLFGNDDGIEISITLENKELNIHCDPGCTDVLRHEFKDQKNIKLKVLEYYCFRDKKNTSLVVPLEDHEDDLLIFEFGVGGGVVSERGAKKSISLEGFSEFQCKNQIWLERELFGEWEGRDRFGNDVEVLFNADTMIVSMMNVKDKEMVHSYNLTVNYLYPLNDSGDQCLVVVPKLNSGVIRVCLNQNRQISIFNGGKRRAEMTLQQRTGSERTGSE
jgi:hypothetical protein